MEDNSASDDEVQESPLSPKLSGKKLKLNDGSSQDSFKETASSSKDENVDSGVSADKSESTSSDDRGAPSAECPTNIVVNVAPSGSNLSALLSYIRLPKRTRNYRKRKTPDRDTDSNDSSRDSDDLSAEEYNPAPRQSNSNSESDSEFMQRLMNSVSSDSDDSTSGSNSSSDSNNSNDTDDVVEMQSGDTESEDEGLWSRSNENEESEGNKGKTPSVLLKPRPKHNYFMLKEIINREMGLTIRSGKTAKDDVIFEHKFYGSLNAVYRLKKLHSLSKHKGCVNSINFHPEGHLLASGSDDTNVVVWDWARNVALQTIKTGHKSNVFQSKFLHLNARSQLNIVTCARDGQVRLLQCPPSGAGGASRRRLGAHSRAAHKLAVAARDPHLVVSAGEDGLVMQCDVRADPPSRLFQVKNQAMVVPLYSVCCHPLEPHEMIVAGRDKFVRLYDRRKCTKPIAMYCPSEFREHAERGSAKTRVRLSMMHLTCAVYNHDGSQILGSYNDEDIYLFDVKNDQYDKDNVNDIKDGYTHRYSGHRNSATYKGVSFFGPKSEYVVSGSDCGHIYIWDRETESIVQWMHGDANGVVNCIEAHPRSPVLATSGLDKDVKMWIPRSQAEPNFDGLESVVRENSSSQMRSPLFNDFLPTLYSAWRGETRLNSDDDGVQAYGGNIEFDGNVCTAF